MAKLGTYQPVIDPVTQVVCLGPISIPYTKLIRQNSQWETGKHITTKWLPKWYKTNIGTRIKYTILYSQSDT